MNLYSITEVARILRLSRARLRYWERTGLLRPRPDGRGGLGYGFRDLVCIKTILVLLRNGVPLRRIRRNLEALRQRIPELDRPVDALRIWMEGSDLVVVRHEGVLLAPDGQLVLDFRLAPALPEDVAPLAVPKSGRAEADPETALEWFERGCLLDADPKTEAAALEAYARCVAADPEFADAYCNVGTLHFNHGRREEARGCFQDALEREPDHVEANFNLARLSEEEGRDEAAVAHYKAALRADPLYADAHLGCALLYERIGLRRRARDHWRRYLQLDPEGGWAAIARKHLEE